MKILLTGASGFVGGYLAPALVAAGHEVVALVRDPASYEAPDGVTALEANLESLGELPEADAVAHLAQANVPFPDEAETLYRVNTVSTLQLLEHARRSGARHFVYASSASVYGFGERPFREDDPAEFDNFYAVTKRNAERLVAAYGDFFGTAILRLVAPYGPGQSGRMIPAVIGRVRDGQPVTLNGGGRPRMNPIYVEDAARAFVAALELDGNHIVNVAGEDVVGIDAIAKLAGEALGRKPVFDQGSPDAPGDVVADTTRFREVFALEDTVPVAEGIRRTATAEAHA
ncbi:MAG TPA: NAD(P)-dependent oxidoreductase [Gaiellaceae bacterium]|nr:NAD(P)-dependent oxidoreductase [Gaiellaceae bacterium]